MTCWSHMKANRCLPVVRSWLFLLASAAILHAQPARTPVVVELFTSEGCSSCPPADVLLRRLQQEQPIPGVQVIALSEHVDYWNQLGWKDPFSSGKFTERQRQYSDVLGKDGPYTPQMVVDGSTEFVGSDSQKALKVISEAARRPRASVSLSCEANPLRLQVRIDNLREDADVLLAIAENGLESNVTKGENRGRQMGHDGVTRRLSSIGRARKQQSFTAESKLALENDWRRENLSAVVFLQDRSMYHILGAGKIAISACATN
jgi:hypothetical protein